MPDFVPRFVAGTGRRVFAAEFRCTCGNAIRTKVQDGPDVADRIAQVVRDAEWTGDGRELQCPCCRDHKQGLHEPDYQVPRVAGITDSLLVQRLRETAGLPTLPLHRALAVKADAYMEQVRVWRMRKDRCRLCGRQAPTLKEQGKDIDRTFS